MSTDRYSKFISNQQKALVQRGLVENKIVKDKDSPDAPRVPGTGK